MQVVLVFAAVAGEAGALLTQDAEVIEAGSSQEDQDAGPRTHREAATEKHGGE